MYLITHVCIFTCNYIFIYTYTHILICIYIYTYVLTQTCLITGSLDTAISALCDTTSGPNYDVYIYKYT
jgi:hypothetical protein